MQLVSDEWKNEYQTKDFLNEQFLRITIGITDPDADGDITDVTASSGISYSNPDELGLSRQKLLKRYGTFEQNQWILDSSIEILDSANYDYGFISNGLSGSDRTCDETVNILFGSVHDNSLPGITITWDRVLGGEFASDFSVLIYNDSTLVDSIDVTDNRNNVSEVNLEFQGYNKISIHVTKWCLPNRRVRIEDVMFGFGKTFTKEDILSYSHEMIINTFGEGLPKNEIQFELDNKDRIFDVLENSGISKYIMSRQKVDTEYGMKLDDDTIEYINGGTYYLSAWSSKYGSTSASFTARDKLNQLTKVIPNTPMTATNLRTLFQNVLNASPLESTEYVLNISSTIGNYAVGYLPKDCTFANALKYLAQAACIAMWIDRDGVFHFEPLDDTAEDYLIYDGNMFDYPLVTKSSPLKEMIIKVYTYTSSTESTATDWIYTISGNSNDTGMIIDNPLITSNNGAQSLAVYIVLNQVDLFTVESNYRSDPRLDVGDKLNLGLSAEIFNTIARNLKYTFNGIWRGICKSSIVNTTIEAPTIDINFTPSNISYDLTYLFGVHNLATHPSIGFDIVAQTIPNNSKKIEWSLTATNITATPGDISDADTIVLTPTNNGRNLHVDIIGNFQARYVTNGFYSFSTNSLYLTATTIDGYSENCNINIQNSANPNIVFDGDSEMQTAGWVSGSGSEIVLILASDGGAFARGKFDKNFYPDELVIAGTITTKSPIVILMNGTATRVPAPSGYTYQNSTPNNITLTRLDDTYCNWGFSYTLDSIQVNGGMAQYWYAGISGTTLAIQKFKGVETNGMTLPLRIEIEIPIGV